MDLPRIGQLFEGRYEIREVLGAGGFAKVYLATDVSVGRAVVLKVLAPTGAEYDGPVRARFLREARVFAELHDPHTITMFDFGESADGLLFMVFEHIAGRDLTAVLASQGRLPPVVVAHVLEQLLSALREAHEKGILHRDIKPANVLVYEYDGDPFRVKLIDFGIAKDTTSDARLTRTGHVVGTVRYMSPEQLLGGEVGPASDLYSVGLVAYELLTGRPAIAGDSQKEMLEQQVSDVPIRVPPAVAPALLRAAIDRLLARAPHNRTRSAADGLRDLRAAHAETPAWVQTVAPVAAREPHGRAERGHARPVGDAERGRRIAVTLGLSFAATTIVALAVAYLLVERSPNASPPPRVREVGLLRATPAASRPVQKDGPREVRAVDTELGETDAPRGDAGRAPTLDGCGQPPPFTGPGELKADLFSNGFQAHIPRNYDPNVRYPVLLMFHRKFTDGGKLLRSSEMGASADERGLIVLSFSSPNPMDWDFEANAGVVRHAVSLLQEQACVDPSRIYAYGDDAGSTFVRNFACSMPLSAVAVTNVTTTNACKADRFPPRIRIYGKHDLSIPAAGGQGCALIAGGFAGAKAVDASWAKVMRCSEQERPWGDYPGGSCVLRECENGPYVVCATDSGEVWPHSAPMFEPDKCTAPKPAVPFPHRTAIVDFFEKEGRAIEPWR